MAIKYLRLQLLKESGVLNFHCTLNYCQWIGVHWSISPLVF